MENILEVRNLTAVISRNGKMYNAVDDISFTVKKGETLGIAGETGCGKTMAALCIPGLLPRSARIIKGEIIYKNQNLLSLSDNEMRRIRGKEISFIFQETKQALNPLIKAGRQIAEMIELAGLNNKEGIINKKKRTLEILHRLGFNDAKIIYNSYPYQLSLGMCQRVMAAIAAVNIPSLLLADEPSSSLDGESQERILSLLGEMNSENETTIIIISHDLSIIRQFCSRFLVMYAGKIIEEGVSGENFSPLHPYTRALIASIPNKDKYGSELENIPGKVPAITDIHPGCPFAPRCKYAKDICNHNFPEAKKTGNNIVHCFFCGGYL